MATFFLPATVLRSSGEWPCTSALGLRTRRYSAARSKVSPLSNTTVSAFLSLRSRSSVGQGLVAAMRRSISGRAMAERGAGGALLARVDVEVDHADAAGLEHRDAARDRRAHVGRARDRPDADRALRLGELGDVGHRILHAQPDPAVL